VGKLCARAREAHPGRGHSAVASPPARRGAWYHSTVAVVGLLHPGAMGAAVGAVARADVLWVPEGRSAATAERARDAGLHPTTLDELLERADVVLSICPPHAALDVARAAAGLRGLYCDANAIAPATAHEVAAVVEAGGATFVDGGIVGGPPTEPGTRLYLSGDAAGEVAVLFRDTHLEAIVLGHEIGAASALKMCYAGWSKGAAALVIALAEAAEELGVADELHAEWRHSAPELPERLERARRSADAKGWRWIGEMEEIAATLRSVGLPGGFHDAAADVYRRA
jgi:3-hydroxyisobutyrate dehydrogenase-like beta-hydroxyacid dehydrogenase